MNYINNTKHSSGSINRQVLHLFQQFRKIFWCQFIQDTRDISKQILQHRQSGTDMY